MSEFELWLYRGLIAVLILIVAWAARMFASKVFDKFDKLIVAVQSLTGQLITHEGQIKQICDRQTDHSARLNDHSKRIRGIELGQAGVKHQDK